MFETFMQKLLVVLDIKFYYSKIFQKKFIVYKSLYIW